MPHRLRFASAALTWMLGTLWVLFVQAPVTGDVGVQSPTGSAGGGQAFSDLQPSLGINYFVPLTGIYPSRGGGFGNPGVQTLANVRMFGGNFAPGHSVPADGRVLPISQNQAMFSLVGTMYGGDGRTTFGVPDFSGRAVLGAGQGPGLSRWREGQKGGTEHTTLSVSNLASHNHSIPAPINATHHTGGSIPFSNIQPSQALNYVIAMDGVYPSRSDGTGPGTFLGQVALFAGNFAPRGWEIADGRLLSLSDSNTHALFSILGTTYGGDGRTTFALPDLRGRAPVHPGSGPGLTPVRLGERFGGETTQLTINNLASHNHDVTGSNPTGNTGGQQRFSNMQPYLGVNYLIATQGLFPSEDGGIPGETLLGEITMFGGNFAPRGWALADGQLLPIDQNQSLYSLLGTTYGGDGETTFALPDLRGRAAVNYGDGAGLDPWGLGEKKGTNFTTLTTANLPSHTHTFNNEPGTSMENPMLPTTTNAEGGFVFMDAPSGHWIDPPTATGYSFEMIPDEMAPISLFTSIAEFPSTFAGPFEVWVGDVLLGEFEVDASVTFSDAEFVTPLGDLLVNGIGVESFTIAGIDPPVDPTDTMAFPVRLTYSTPTANLTMTPIPEPGTLAGLLIVGLITSTQRARRR